MNIKEQLEQWIEQRANEAGAMASTSPRDKFDIAKLSYKAGANEMKELLLIACDALDFNYEYYAAKQHKCIDLLKDQKEVLDKIQEKIKGE